MPSTETGLGMVESQSERSEAQLKKQHDELVDSCIVEKNRPAEFILAA